MIVNDRYDVVVVGAGPAGSTAAACLAQEGMRVALIDRDTFPRDKLCGEFLSGESRNILGEIGCLAEIENSHPALIERMCFVSTNGSRAIATLPHSAFGFSRRKLDDILLNHSRRSGADVYVGCEVSELLPSDHNNSFALIKTRHSGSSGGTGGEFQAKLVIAAYGRHTHLDHAASRAFTRLKHLYIGFKLHHRVRTEVPNGLDGQGEVYSFPGGYCGLCRVEDGLVNVCMLLHKGFLTEGARWPDIITKLGRYNKAFRERMEMLEPCTEPIQTVAQVPFERKELVRNNIFYVGDAAGMIAPMCGDGQAMALDSGLRLSRLIAANRQLDEQKLGQLWTQEWQSTYRLRMRLARVLQVGLFKESVANLAIAALQKVPRGVIDTLARATRG